MLVGLVLLAMAFGPLITLSVLSKQNEKRLQKLLRQFAQQHKLNFTKVEYREQRAFAIDEVKAVFVALRFSPEAPETVETIDLDGVSHCYAHFGQPAEKQGAEEEVSELVFMFRKVKTPAKIIRLFEPGVDNSADLKAIQYETRRWAEAIQALVLDPSPVKRDDLPKLAAPRVVWKYPKAG